MSGRHQKSLEQENKELRTQLASVSSERDKYKALFDTSGDALSIIDLNSGKFVECNQSAVNMHGVLDKNNFLDLSPSDISPQYQPCGNPSAALANEYIEKAFAEGPQLFQWRHSRLDGSIFPCLVSLSAFQIQGENLILAIGRDISELMAARALLDEAQSSIERYKKAYQQEKEKFELFVNLAPIGIAINAMKGGAFHYVNKEFGSMTGYSVDELNSMDYWALTPRKYEKQEQEQLCDMQEKGRYGPYHKEYIHKKGNHFPVLLSGIMITDSNGDDFIWSVVQDTSQQKEAEAKIHKAREQADSFAFRMQLANDSAGIGVWEWDLISNELIWDDWMFKLYGVPKSQFSGVYEYWEQAVHPDDITYAKASLQRALTENTIYDPEFRVIHPNKNVRTLKASAEVIKDNTGKPIKVIGVNYDVTDKINAIEKLEAAKKEAENSAKAKGEFLANMSHEIRTPMNAILGGLQLLQNTELKPDLRKVLDNAAFSAKSLLTIINDILDYSKIESNKIELEYASLLLLDVIESVKYDLDSLISNKGIDFIVSVDENYVDGWVGDLVRIKQILLNLTSNAVKFTHQGTVKIKLSCIAYKNEQAVQISIKDSGIGMSSEVQARIFDRFSQADTSTTRQYGGTGLGMSITLSLVKMMQGSLKLASELGRGTMIDVILPLARASKKSEMTFKKSLNPPDLKGKYVLVAEDNKINQILISTMLKGTKAELVLVDNGALAVDAFKEQKFDLVLMDINMPIMDGVQAQHEISLINRATPVIALTANVMVEDVNRYLEQGFNAHIPKPIDLNILYGVLSDYIKLE
ncbi:Sensor histidine kinase RcsC [Pseudoalteromonas holothuriae]|uniref:histidine kinase n=1 Tax=Pseudoalteromonas holothuriae TaxID=2963714 RepID=A0ABN8UTF0_9GAMM|nr:PAS domain S-box protein [Pseudoalteromonas sp. CIP111951]CAH9067958.1 Sensor histidine kinase RcsC [Pseudoalteromonas sp. CIP111951]